MINLILVYAAIFISITLAAWFLVSRGILAWGNYRENFTEAANSKLSEMFLFVDARKIFAFNVFALVGVPILVYLVSDFIFIAIISGLSMFIVPKMFFKFLAKRRLSQFESALPDTLTMIAGGMRAGSSMAQAIETTVAETDGPISQEFSLVLREQRVGVPMDQALENLGKRVNSYDLTLVLSAARIGRDVGGNLSEIFDRLASTLRQKASMEGKIAALTSQGKMQGWVVGMLPIGMILILFQMETESMMPLFTSVGGWGILLIIGMMEILGMIFIRKIVDIDI